MQVNLRDYAEIRPGDQLKVQAHLPYLNSIVESGWAEVSVASAGSAIDKKINERTLSEQNTTTPPGQNTQHQERRGIASKGLYLLVAGGILIAFLAWWARSRIQ